MKKSEVAQVYKGADEKSWQELLDDLRPQGEWIVNTETRIMKCNRCGATEKADRLLVDDMNFCYHCGADMKKGSAENER